MTDSTQDKKSAAAEAKADAAAAKAKAKALRPWFKKKRIIFPLILLVIIVISVASNSGKNGSDTAATNTSGETSSESKDASGETKLPVIGEAVTDGKFTFTVTGIECGIASVGDEFAGATAQGQYCRVAVTILNSGKEPQTMFADNQKLFDTEGREFSPDTSAMIWDGDNGKAWMEEINPGNTLNGALLFDLPAAATPSTIELHDSAFSKGVTVSLQ